MGWSAFYEFSLFVSLLTQSGGWGVFVHCCGWDHETGDLSAVCLKQYGMHGFCAERTMGVC